MKAESIRERRQFEHAVVERLQAEYRVSPDRAVRLLRQFPDVLDVELATNDVAAAAHALLICEADDLRSATL